MTKTGMATYTVDPGDLDHFDWTAQPGANQDAGVTFPETIQVTAYDEWDNVKTNYDPAGPSSRA